MADVKRALTKGLDDVVMNIVTKTLDTPCRQMPERPGIVKRTVGGMATGAGIGAMRRLPQGIDNVYEASHDGVQQEIE